MKRTLLLLLSGFLCSAIAVAQISINQRGKATQELRSDGITIAHPSLPINSVVRVTNTKTGKEVDATVVDRIPASANRIADLSAGAWQELGLSADGEIRISSIPVVRQRVSSNPDPAPAAPPPPPPAIAQAPPPPPPQPAPQPAAAPAPQPVDSSPDYPLNVRINNYMEQAPVKAAPPPPPPPTRYVPDADLQVRLAAVNAMAHQYSQPPQVIVVQAPEPVREPPPVVESPVYQVLVVPVYQIQQAPAAPQPPPPPPAPVYYAPPPVVAAPVVAAPVIAPVIAASPAYAHMRVYPGFPDPYSGRTHCLQIASFYRPEAAARVAYQMRYAGFNVYEEQALPYYRVIVPNIPAAMVHSTIQRLGATGVIEEIWVR